MASEVVSPDTNDLRRVETAPGLGTGTPSQKPQRPRQTRYNTSVFHRVQPVEQKRETPFYFNPELYNNYEESSGDESTEESDRRVKPTTSHLQLERSSTAPQHRLGGRYKRFAFGTDAYTTRGHVSKHDGRLNISLNETGDKGYLAKLLSTCPRSQDVGENSTSPEARPDGEAQPAHRTADDDDNASEVSDLSSKDPLPIPKLNIVVMIIGSRGDIQPFLKLGKILKEQYGHRVRIATHPTFKKFVEEDAKLEFFSVGGNPAELMAFMVKNPGLLPKTETITSGEIPKRRAEMFTMFQGFWRACICDYDDESGPSSRRFSRPMEPFVADAIIANPPSFAHIHCAERLGIPLHLMFTFPNTPTQQFPHPLTNIRQTNVDANYTNLMSYPLVEMMEWQGLGDLINNFRVKTLGLEAISALWAPGQIYRMKVPYSYLWSPALIPKPPDWGSEINITGFVFLDLASSFTPPDELTNFLNAGEPPVYIGFGSIVVDDPDRFTTLIFEAVRKAGVRALVSKGWGGLGADIDVPDNIFLLDNTPHDWLFPRVSAVVHHGGAGTTAIGLKCGKPTMVVPFFGDQPFWGAMVAKANAGALPVPYKQLTAEKLADGIKVLLTPEKQEGATVLADKIAAEGNGALNAVKSFHKHLPTRRHPNMRCSILRDRVATWHLKGSSIQLCSLAAHMLVEQKKITWKDVRLLRIYEWNDFESPGEPLTGVGSSLFKSVVGIGAGVGRLPFQWAKIIKKHSSRNKKQARRRALSVTNASIKQNKLLAASRKEKTKSSRRNAIADQHENLATDGDGLESNLPRSNQPDGLTQALSQPSGRQAFVPLGDDQTGMAETSVARHLAVATGRGMRDSGFALVKLPINLLIAVARGFHNAPRLYGDDTVRSVRRISGVQSGLCAAGCGAVLGVYDGVGGVVLQPYKGAKYGGVGGFLRGAGLGVGGFILKDAAAIFGIPAYISLGLYKEMTKKLQPTGSIRRSRIIEGIQQYARLSCDEVLDTSERLEYGWQIVEEIRWTINTVIKQKHLQGRVKVWRDRRWLIENGVIGDIGMMQRALESYREGRDWKLEFRAEIEQHRRDQEIEEQKRHDADKQRFRKVEKNKKSDDGLDLDVRGKTPWSAHRALRRVLKRDEKGERAVIDSANHVSTKPSEFEPDAPRPSARRAAAASEPDTSANNQEHHDAANDNVSNNINTDAPGNSESREEDDYFGRQSPLPVHKNTRLPREDSDETLVQRAGSGSAPSSPKTTRQDSHPSSAALKPVRALSGILKKPSKTVPTGVLGSAEGAALEQPRMAVV